VSDTDAVFGLWGLFLLLKGQNLLNIMSQSFLILISHDPEDCACRATILTDAEIMLSAQRE